MYGLISGIQTSYQSSLLNGSIGAKRHNLFAKVKGTNKSIINFESLEWYNLFVSMISSRSMEGGAWLRDVWNDTTYLDAMEISKGYDIISWKHMQGSIY